ncbi:hypothetical protein JCM16303_004392 [Sporobolomyces ruberrimus]
MDRSRISHFSIQASHASELANLSSESTSRQSWTQRAKSSVPLAFALYLWNTVTSWIWTFVTSPASILLDPLSTLTALVVYPVVWFGLAIATFVFWIAGLSGGGKIIRDIADKYANGYSMVNWANPNIFGNESFETMQDARPMLAGQYRTTIPPGANINDDNPMFGVAKTVRLFSVPLAKALLLMSALVYERKDEFVVSASDLTAQAERAKVPGSRERLLKEAEEQLNRSEQVIKDQASIWGFKYEGVSELGTTGGGPFASIFYTSTATHESPFIVLVFKGTGPQNYAEFLVDATINRVPASVFFGAGAGTCHQGFYTSLFMTNDTDRRTGSDAYGTIIRTLQHTAARMKQELGQTAQGGQVPDIPLWVAGHSLGSALASLFYARCLRSPQDLGTDISLRDCYSYGTPRLGDGDFTSAFEETICTPRDRLHILWRVQNHLDVVTMVPPGLADNESGRSTLSTVSCLNYAHLGPAMVLRPFRIPFFSRLFGSKHAKSYRVDEAGAFHEAVSVQIADDSYSGGYETSQADAATLGYVPSKVKRTFHAFEEVTRRQGWWKNPLNLLQLLPAPLYDHFPAAYLADLDLMETTAVQHGIANQFTSRRSSDTVI